MTLCVSDELRVPTAIGFTKPLVVIPSWTMQELSTLELNAILLHELAHLRRRDDWTNLIQKIVGALLFFHPAVWWIEKKLALEREMACDDLVLAKTTSPRAYAECLVSLAEKSFLRRGIALAQAAVDRLRNVSLRVTQILDVNRSRATGVWSPAPVLVAGVSLVCVMALSHAPTRLVSFERRRCFPVGDECDRVRRFRSEPDVTDGSTDRSRQNFACDQKRPQVQNSDSRGCKACSQESFKVTSQARASSRARVQRSVEPPLRCWYAPACTTTASILSFVFRDADRICTDPGSMTPRALWFGISVFGGSRWSARCRTRWRRELPPSLFEFFSPQQLNN